MAPPAKAGPTEPGPLAYEGEGLAVGAKATEGAVVVQPMAQFGPAWSHNAQLLWMPSKAGGSVDIGLQLPGGQRYLVDCAVAALTKVTYRVALPPEVGGGVQLFPCVIPPNLGQHLLVVFDLQALDPKTSYPCGANLSVQEPNGQWIFFSCEVTKL